MGVERPQNGIPVETPIPLRAGVAACLVRAGVGGKVRRRRAATKPPCASDGRGGASAGVARDCHRAASRQAPPRAGNAVGGRERAPPTPPMASDPEPPPRVARPPRHAADSRGFCWPAGLCGRSVRAQGAAGGPLAPTSAVRVATPHGHSSLTAGEGKSENQQIHPRRPQLPPTPRPEAGGRPPPPTTLGCRCGGGGHDATPLPRLFFGPGLPVRSPAAVGALASWGLTARYQ